MVGCNRSQAIVDIFRTPLALAPGHFEWALPSRVQQCAMRKLFRGSLAISNYDDAHVLGSFNHI
jgi:hypothetical protein